MRILTISICTALFLSNCFMQQPVAVNDPPPPILVPTFDYTPPAIEAKDTNKIALILLKPFYVAEKHYSTRGTSQYLSLNGFQDFKEKMGIDFEEALTSIGYTIKGPYSTEDEIVYTDKRNSDLLVSIEIDLNINDDNVRGFYETKTVYSYPSSYNVTQYNFKGTIVLDGKINIIVRAVTKTGFGDKLSVRSIPIDRKIINVESYKKNYQNNNYYGVISTDPGLYNPIVSELQSYYQVVFNKAWNYLDPAEFKEYKKLAEEIKGK